MKFFVVGSGRCGTTLLWEVLDLHPEVFVFRETHWIPKLFEHYGTGEAPVGELLRVVERTAFVDGTRTTPLPPGVRDEVLAAGPRLGVRAFCDLLGQGFARAAGKPAWGDKTPDYTNHLEVLGELFPQARVLHLIRDGRQVARSMAGHPGYRWLVEAGEVSWVPASFGAYRKAVETGTPHPLQDYLRLWRRRIRRARAAAPGLGARYREFRYEALLADPRPQLEAMAEHLELAAAPAWLDAAAARVRPGRSWPPPELEIPPEEAALLEELGYA